MSAVAASLARPAPAQWIRNRVLFALMAVSFLVIAKGGFLDLAANRLAAGRAVALWDGPQADAAVLFGLLAALTIAAFVAQTRTVLIGALVGAALILLATLAAAGHLSAILARDAAPATRLSLGPAFWILVATSSLSMIDTLQRLRAGTFWAGAIAVASSAAIAALALSGAFDQLSLAKEFATHHELFLAALARHLELVAASLALAILCGAPLTLLLLRRARARPPVFTILNLLQTIPSIALFGLLIGPLSIAAEHLPLLRRLGVGGIGAAPAVIALVLYALLPLVRNATAGFDGVAPAVIESARGMGMNEREIFWQARFPLALPALVSALRIVTIQSIGLTTIAALIGAGGLGTFVFQGIGEYALDLVLLGALPILLLALAADLLFQLWLAALRGPP